MVVELRVDLLDQVGRPAEADALLAARAADDPEAAAELARRRARRVEQRDLATRIHAARAARPEDPDTAYDLGVVLQGLGDLAGAAEHLGAAVALRPEDAEARAALLRLRLAQDDLAGAAAAIAPVLADPAAHPTLACDTGRLLAHHLDRVEEARPYLVDCAATGEELLPEERDWAQGR